MYSIHSNNSCINNTPFSFILLEKGCVHNLFTHAFVVGNRRNSSPTLEVGVFLLEEVKSPLYTPEAFAKQMAEELAVYKNVVQKQNLKMED